MAAEPTPKPRYIVVEYETQENYASLAAALDIAKAAHENDRTRGFAVVELIAIVGSEHKTVVTRLK